MPGTTVWFLASGFYLLWRQQERTGLAIVYAKAGDLAVLADGQRIVQFPARASRDPLVQVSDVAAHPQHRMIHQLAIVPDHAHPDDLAHGQDQLQLLRSGQIDSVELEKRYVRSDGSLLWGRLSSSVVRESSTATGGSLTELTVMLTAATFESALPSLAL